MSAWNDYYLNYGGGRQALAAQQNAQQQQAAQDQLMARYGQMNQQVQAGIKGVGAAQSREIADAYARAQGDTTQSAASRGLGNTTVLDSLQRGNLADKQKADVALSSQLAQLSAGYTSQFGMAGLQAQQQFDTRNQQFGQQQQLAQQQYGYQSALAGQQFGYQQQQYGQIHQGPYGAILGRQPNYNPWANAGGI